jgi:hypothetical protein
MRLLSALLGGVLLFLLFFMIGVTTLHQLVGGGARPGSLSPTASRTFTAPSQGSLVKVDSPSTPDQQDSLHSLTPGADSSGQLTLPVSPGSPERAKEPPSLSAILILEDGLPPGAVTIYQDGESLWRQHNGLLKPLEPSRFQALLRGRYYIDGGPLPPAEARRHSLPTSARMLLVLTQSDSAQISSLLQGHQWPTDGPVVVTIRYSREDGLSIAKIEPEQKGGTSDKGER